MTRLNYTDLYVVLKFFLQDFHDHGKCPPAIMTSEVLNVLKKKGTRPPALNYSNNVIE